MNAPRTVRRTVPTQLIANQKTKSGQAMMEFLVGLVCIMLLIIGLQQAALLSGRTFEAYSNVRAELAYQVSYPNADYTGEYIFTEQTDIGPDEKIYTGDDKVVPGDDSFYTEGQGFLHMVDYASLKNYLWDYELIDYYYRLSDSSFSVLSESFQMFHAYDAQEVEVVPFLRKIIKKDTLLLERYGWMPAWDKLNVEL